MSTRSKIAEGLKSWFSAIILGITLVGNSRAFLELADWVKFIADHWNYAINLVWNYLFEFIGLTIPTEVAQLLTVFSIAFIPALVSRFRFGEWSHTQNDGLLTQESRAQNAFVPINIVLLTAYVYILVPGFYERIRNVCNQSLADFECVSSDYLLFGSVYFALIATIVAYILAILLITAAGHPRTVFWTLVNGLIFGVIIFLLSEVSKLDFNLPNPKELEPISLTNNPTRQLL